MRIGTKLLLGFIPLAVLTAMVAEVLYINSKWISDSSQIVREIYQNYGNISEMRRQEKNYLFYREKFYLYRIKDISDRMMDFISRREGLSGQEEIAGELRKVKEALSQYQSLTNRLLLADRGPQAEQTISEMATIGFALERMSEDMINLAWIPMQIGTRKARTYALVFAVQAALIGAVLAFYLSQLLVKPIQQLVQGTKKVAEGDLSQRVRVRSRDEIGDLADSFNRMVLSLEQSQAKLQQSSQELLETKDTLENIVESSADAIITTDSRGAITFVNRSLQEMLVGRKKEELLGIPVARLYAGGLPEARKVMAILRERGRLLNYETNMVQNGRIIPILTSASLLKDGNGKLVGTLGIIKDLTEKKKLEDQLRKAQSELVQTEKLAAIGRLASGVAHELNDPLTSVLTFSNLLREETHEGDPSRESLEIILKEAVRARKIVSDLLSFSRESRPTLEWIDLNEVLNTSLSLLEKQGALEEIEVAKDLAVELPLVQADSGQIHQVFTNILLNAIQAMGSPSSGDAKSSPAGREKKLGLRTNFQEGREAAFSPGGPFIQVVIEDSGCGIPAENLSKIFDPFFTTKRTGEGTGLGLYIVSGILKNYGAQYRLESEEGRGTIFTIDFPLSKSGEL